MKRILVAALVATAFTGCRKSDIQTENKSTINLVASVAEFHENHPQKPTGSQSKSATKTKSETAEFAIGQALGLFVHTTPTIGKAAECHSQNIEYATPDGGKTWNQRASLDNDLTNGTTYYATAYSPYVEGQIDPLAMPFSVEKDQTELAKFEKSDLRLTPASPLTGAGTAINATLDFTHALAMFELKLLIPANVEGKAVAQLETVTFENLATKTTVNLATGASTIDLQSVASITPRIISGTGAVAVMTTYRAHVPPQNVDGGVTLAKIRCKMVDGSTETMDYVTPSKGWISFQAGVRTSLTLMPTAEAAFMGELPELMDGRAHTDMELPIFVEAGLRWTVDGAGSNWLSIADKKGGTYGQKLTGTSATGGWQNIYIKVTANESQTTPRTGDLTLRAWRTDNSEAPAAVLRLVQNYYTFAPVGGVWNTSAVAASDPVQPFASNQQWTATSDAPWLLLATSSAVGSGNPAQKYVHSGALGANKLFLQVSENGSATARRGVVTITSPVAGSAPIKIYVNQMGNQPYVEVGGVRWATGNLVATRSSVDGVSAPGCMIGAPDDGGLYFQFGSLIGWKGGALEQAGTGITIPETSLNGKWWNGASAWSWNNDAMVWPSNLSGKPTAWPQNATTNQWYFGLQSGWSTPEQNIRTFPGLVAGNLSNVGVGDPCTYYLGGTWRLPTSTEHQILCNNKQNETPWVDAGGAWVSLPVEGGYLTEAKLFLPASGFRHSTNNGVLSGIFIRAYCLSSLIGSNTASISLAGNPAVVYPWYGSDRSRGCPVRCVQPVPTVPNPPAESDYVEINGLRWAKGNLVAVNPTNAKVGKPEDGGVYFQFGSLIGYKGGNQANGGNGVGSNPYTGAGGTQWWGGATAWSWNNDAALTPDKLEGNPTAWPTNTTNQWYFGLQTSWSTTEQNIRDFPGLAAGDLADTGVGDPCTYYLGGTWRLPTGAEYATMCKNQSGIDSEHNWSSVGGSWIDSPTNGGNFAGERLFFPASGYRFALNGSFYNVTTYGYGLSNSVYNTSYSLHFRFNNSLVNPQRSNNRSHAFPARCVQAVPHKPNPPTADDYVEINGLKWAKGNLVATGPHNAKVGKPEDGGVYFQFGSLIGYKGGAQSNGGTGVGSNPYTDMGTQWWGGKTSYSWTNDVMVWPSELVGTKSSWTNTAGSGISTLTDYYFNYSLDWETAGQDIRTFAVSISGDKGTGNLASGRYAKQGVGDPCTYYLGGTWRLPLTTDFISLCNGQSGGGWIAWSAVGGSWGTSPTQGGNFYSNKLFFPASGYRYYSNGSFNYVTAYGYCWSSSVTNATGGYYLTFYQANGVIPQGSSHRSYGLPVRCVSN